MTTHLVALAGTGGCIIAKSADRPKDNSSGCGWKRAGRWSHHVGRVLRSAASHIRASTLCPI